MVTWDDYMIDPAVELSLLVPAAAAEISHFSPSLTLVASAIALSLLSLLSLALVIANHREKHLSKYNIFQN